MSSFSQKKTSSEAVRLVRFHPQACKKYDDVIFTIPAVFAFAIYIIVFIFLLVEQ
jgi:hypothetical protein